MYATDGDFGRVRLTSHVFPLAMQEAAACLSAAGWPPVPICPRRILSVSSGGKPAIRPISISTACGWPGPVGCCGSPIEPWPRWPGTWGSGRAAGLSSCIRRLPAAPRGRSGARPFASPAHPVGGAPERSPGSPGGTARPEAGPPLCPPPPDSRGG